MALVVPDRAVLGVFNLRGVALMSLYLLGLFSALGSALAAQNPAPRPRAQLLHHGISGV